MSILLYHRRRSIDVLKRLSLFVVSALWCATVAAQDPNAPKAPDDRSHSHIGDEFNTGPRQLARLIPDIGNAHFPITTNSPKAQRFFDQGMNMLYTFWWYEAERAFRQVVMLDPDCAMGYWGLAYASSKGHFFNDANRTPAFMKMAQERASKASDREQRYIAAALEFMPKPRPPKSDSTTQNKNGDQTPFLNAGVANYDRFIARMKDLMARYPGDVEAKIIYGSHLEDYFDTDWTRRAAQWEEAGNVYDEVIRLNPQHTGAHHFKIHLWDDRRKYALALSSTDPLATNAPNVGHAQHMSGHIYTALGMWEQGVTRMDAAARDERQYMYTQGRMPFHTWNYFHNEDYLIFALGFAGRIRNGLKEVREEMLTPKNPEDSYDWGANGYLAMLIKGERWDDLLNGEAAKTLPSRTQLLYGQGMASLAKGDRDAARRTYEALQQHVATSSETRNMLQKALAAKTMTFAEFDVQQRAIDVHTQWDAPTYLLELGGLIKAYQGDLAGGLVDLREAQKNADNMLSDPSPYPHAVAESIARALIFHKQYQDAERELTDSAARWHNNGYAYALTIEAQLADGRPDDARKTYQQLQEVWKYADPDLPALARTQRLMEANAGVPASRWSPTPAPTTGLEHFGPSVWKPFPAAPFTVYGADGTPIRLADYRGKNLVLVFYLGGECAHCVAQLAALGKDQAEFAQLGATILAVSADSVSVNQRFMQENPAYPIRLATDKGYRAAKAMAAYDEFEHLELHATLLIDKKGEVWWYNAGSQPFMNLRFLKAEIGRMNEYQGTALAVGAQ